MGHIGLQFGGDDDITKQFRANFKESAEEAIATIDGREVNLFGEHRDYPIEKIISDAITVDRHIRPPATSILYEPGNCILLGLYLLVGDVDLYNTYCEVALSMPIEGKRARPYKDCVDYTQ